jgi:hypothetical protein
MIKKAIALAIPAGGAVAYFARRRKRSAAGHDVSPGDLQRTDAPQTGTGRPSTLEGLEVVVEGKPPPDAAIPDLSDEDPLVRKEAEAAAAEAARIGGRPADNPAVDRDDFGDDPATRPVEEHAGNAYEEFEELEQDR